MKDMTEGMTELNVEPALKLKYLADVYFAATIKWVNFCYFQDNTSMCTVQGLIGLTLKQISAV